MRELRQTAWRVVNGPGDGAPAGLTLDRYADWLVLNAREDVSDELVQRWADAALEALRPAGLVLKRLHTRAADSTSRVLAGQLAEEPVAVVEDDATFLCDLDDGLATGLYIDLHDVRRQTRAFASGVEVLNLFAYTGAFSVHAALAGAERVTSVDVSQPSLTRGRENMSASGLDPDRHRWFRDDVLEHLARGVRRGDQYGLVIVDPPAFGRAGGRTFSLKRDLERLVRGASSLIRRDGVLVLSVHTASVEADRVDRAIDDAATAAGRRVTTLATFGLPKWDHPTAGRDPHDRGDYLRVLVAKYV